jgi:hypothetical protein
MSVSPVKVAKAQEADEEVDLVDPQQTLRVCITRIYLSSQDICPLTQNGYCYPNLKMIKIMSDYS